MSLSVGDTRQGCIVYATSYYNGRLVYWLDGDLSNAFYAEDDSIAQCSVGDKYVRLFSHKEVEYA